MAALIERVSFAAGEIGTALQARADLARYQIAVEKMENYLVMVEGGANRRPGTRFVLPLKNPAEPGHFVPFRLSAADYYMLVFNASAVRFLRDGGFLESSPGVPYEVIGLPYLAADLPNMRSVSRGNVVFIACKGKRISEFTRVGLVNWTVAPIVTRGGPFMPINLNGGIVVSSSASTGAGVVITANSPIFRVDHINTTWRIDEGDLALVPEWQPAETGLIVGDLRRYGGNVYQAITPGDAGVTPPTHTDGAVTSVVGGVQWLFLHGPFGTVLMQGFTDSTHMSGNVTKPIPLSAVAPHATFRWWAPAWSDTDGWPENIAWAGQRMWYFRRDEFWASGILDPHDLEETLEDDKAFSGRILSPDPTGANVETTWAVSPGALVVGSNDVEWIFRSSAGVFETVTAKTVRPVPDTNEGSQSQIPALVDGGVMFAARTGRRLLYGKIDPNGTGSQRMDVSEVTVAARHIPDPGIATMAWQRDPNRLLWMTLRDGTLAAMTWMPKQDVLAPHRHPMANGVIEEVGVLPNNPLAQDDVYMIVRRTIAGTPTRYVELLQPAFSSASKQKDASGGWHVDCGLALHSSVPVTVISGLAHLNGETVAVVADGAEQSRKVVAAGSITLDRPAKDILIGEPIVSKILDLPRNLQTQEGPSTGQERTVHEINVHLLNCGGGTIGTVTLEDGEELEAEELLDTGDKVMGQPVQLFHGLKRVTVECEVGEQVRVQLVNDDAMPCQVLGISPRLDIEEQA